MSYRTSDFPLTRSTDRPRSSTMAGRNTDYGSILPSLASRSNSTTRPPTTTRALTRSRPPTTPNLSSLITTTRPSHNTLSTPRRPQAPELSDLIAPYRPSSNTSSSARPPLTVATSSRRPSGPLYGRGTDMRGPGDLYLACWEDEKVEEEDDNPGGLAGEFKELMELRAVETGALMNLSYETGKQHAKREAQENAEKEAKKKAKKTPSRSRGEELEVKMRFKNPGSGKSHGSGQSRHRR